MEEIGAENLWRGPLCEDADRANRSMDTSIYMPDGTPVPEVMLEDELIRFLRLRELGIKNPAGTLRHYRELGVLKPCRIGHRNVYTKSAACAFLEKLTKK